MTMTWHGRSSGMRRAVRLRRRHSGAGSRPWPPKPTRVGDTLLDAAALYGAKKALDKFRKPPEPPTASTPPPGGSSSDGKS